MNTSLVRVRRRNPCPICDKPDWCSTSADGAIVICMRVAEGAIRESKDGGFIHILKERDYQPINLTPRVEPPPVASLERRDAVYRAMLGASTLAARHVAGLERRGLSSLSIARNAYASLPPS